MIVLKKGAFTSQNVVNEDKEVSSEILIDKFWFDFIDAGESAKFLHMCLEVHVGSIPSYIEVMMVKWASVWKSESTEGS